MRGDMKFVNVAELKNRLSAYLSLVRNGERSSSEIGPCPSQS